MPKPRHFSIHPRNSIDSRNFIFTNNLPFRHHFNFFSNIQYQNDYTITNFFSTIPIFQPQYGRKKKQKDVRRISNYHSTLSSTQTHKHTHT